MSDVKVSLDHFEGPLALLLYLIRKEEMDILNINIVQITDQYLSFVKNMKTLDLETAGDFIAMAATLIQIKSKLLMPVELLDEDEDEIEDPRKELVDRLIEYKKFQEAGAALYQKPLLGRDVWSKGFKEKNLRRPDDVVKVDENPLYALILHYKKAIQTVKKSVHRVGAKIQSIASRVMEIKKALLVEKKSSLKVLAELPSDFTTDISSRLLITFLSMLELSKMGFVHLFQSQNYADIHLSVIKDLTGDLVSQVDDYENLNEDLQTELFANSQITINPEVDFADDVEDEATDDEIAEAEKEIMA